MPDVTVSEVILLIQKGILSSESSEHRKFMFEATLHIYDINKGNSLEDLKKLLSAYKDEYYVEKGKTLGQLYLHFYSLQRAKDCVTFLRYTPNAFSNVEMIQHTKDEEESKEEGKNAAAKEGEKKEGTKKRSKRK